MGNFCHCVRVQREWSNKAYLWYNRNVLWRGALLRQVLIQLGVPEDFNKIEILKSAHVEFISRGKTQEDSYYGSSITLDHAMDPRYPNLLATRLNKEPVSLLPQRY